jgi:hypothetical protein
VEEQSRRENDDALEAALEDVGREIAVAVATLGVSARMKANVAA